MLYLANAFSLNMLPREWRRYEFMPLSPTEAAVLVYVLRDQLQNVIGHADTAAVVAAVLEAEVAGLELPAPQRVTVRLERDDEVVVAQYVGPRLPEGATRLPEGARIEFWLVTLGLVRREVVWKAVKVVRQGGLQPIVDRLRDAVGGEARAVEVREALANLGISFDYSCRQDALKRPVGGVSCRQ
jgi:hypothetical protein